MNLFFIKTDINMLLLEAFDALAHLAQDKQISFDIALPVDKLVTYADRDVLFEQFSHLIGKTIGISKTAVEVRLIPLDDSERSFTVQFISDGVVMEQPPIAGLSMVGMKKSAVQPLKREPTDHLGPVYVPLAKQPFGQTPSATDGKPQILIVEDNREVLAYLNKELKKHFTILRANSAKEAIHSLAEEAIQLVLTEVGTSTQDGLTLCQYIKSHKLHAHIPVILLSDVANPEVKIKGLLSGVDVYIEKPITVDLLILQMNNLLMNRAILRDYLTHTSVAGPSAGHSYRRDNFMEELHAIIDSNIAEIDLTVDELAKRMNMSRPTLYRKVKRYTDITPNELINVSKLKRAAELLALRKYNITQIAAMVGYTVQSNFSRDFHKHFGTAPSIYGSQFAEQAGLA